MSQRSQRIRNRETQSQNRRSTQSQNTSRSEYSDTSVGENYEQYVIAAVKFILNHSSNKFPIKRADIIKECTEGDTKAFNTILPLAEEKLKSIYGILLKEVKTAAKSTNKQYICVSTIESASTLKLKEDDRRDNSLLFLLLPYMYIKGTSVSEAVLLTFLNRLNIRTDAEHEYFGDVKKKLDKFHKQLYVTRTKVVVENSNEEKIILGWGERANLEFDKRSVLEAAATIFQKPSTYFRKQHMELVANEQKDVEMNEA